MNRYERKFIISFSEYFLLRSALLLAGKPDAHAVKKQRYPVFSKYYDTDTFEFYSQKIEGEFKHVKIRERKYTTNWNTDTTCYLEAKIKQRDEQIKIRVRKDQNGNYPASPEYDCLQEIVYKSNLRASCNVYFEREAYYINCGNEQVKINFDHNICALFPQEHFMDMDLLNRREVSLCNEVLMEVKFGGIELPEKIIRLLKQADIRPTSFSKYIWCIDFLRDQTGGFRDLG